MRRRHEMTDAQWELIEPLLPGQAGDPGVTAGDNRLFFNAIFWLAKTGAPWRDLPERFGKWNSVFQRYNRWCAKDTWWKIAEALGGDEDLEELMLDSSIVRAHQHAAGAKKKTGPEHRAGPLARWIQHEDSRRCQRTGMPGPVPALGWGASRHDRSEKLD